MNGRNVTIATDVSKDQAAMVKHSSPLPSFHLKLNLRLAGILFFFLLRRS